MRKLLFIGLLAVAGACSLRMPPLPMTSNDRVMVLEVPRQHRTIQGAIEAAWGRRVHDKIDSAIIVVAPGNYNEWLTVYSGFSVRITAPKGNVVIDGSKNWNTIKVLGSASLTLEDVVVENKTEDGGGQSATIWVESTSTAVIRKSTITGKKVVVLGSYQNDIVIEDSEIIGGATGIKLYSQKPDGVQIARTEFVNLDVGIDASCTRAKPDPRIGIGKNNNRYKNVKVIYQDKPDSCI